MKKAKTKKNLFSLINAILGVVFAFAVGIVYCVSELSLVYGTRPQSTTAYLENQQYHITNDTVDHPVVFGDGARNFKIALKYSMPYDFDVRFKYLLTWAGTGDPVDASNVILNFANRDNIIYDDEYIYFGETLLNGNGEITFITGVNFTNTKDEAYYGKTLTINITEVKIYRKQTSYELNNHVLTKDITGKISAKAWIAYKNKAAASSAQVVMYNYRNSFATGVSYPGLETAYKKPTTTTTVDGSQVTKVTGPSWLGGNKFYAGTGMYIIAGSSDIKFNVEVAGIWRLKSVSATGDVEIEDVTVPLISENSLQFNYSENWIFEKRDDLKLWETRRFDYTIKANTACYIDILDSIEVTSASRVVTNMYDSYRAVINSITINPSITGTDGKPKLNFKFPEGDPSMKMMAIQTDNSLTTSGNYVKEDVSLINTTQYNNGLYSANIGSDPSSKTFNTNISLINNTSEHKKVVVKFDLRYFIGNGSTAFTTTDTGLRADEVYGTDHLAAFKSNLFYSFAPDTTNLQDYINLPGGDSGIVVNISPYSSVAILETYEAPSQLQEKVKETFGNNSIDFDVWTDVIVTYNIVQSAAGETVNDSLTAQEIQEGYSLKNTNLAIETYVKDSKLYLAVKNISNKTVKGIYIESLSVYELGTATYVETTEPADWAASYWKYYYADPVGSKNYVQYTSNPINSTNPNFPSGVFAKSQSLDLCNDSISAGTGFSPNQQKSEYVGKQKVLNPGDVVLFGSVNLSGTKTITVSGNAYATKEKDANSIMLINGGKLNAFMVNNTEKSYYVRFSGTLSGSQENMFTVASDYNYFIGIVRPGQIISIPMTASGTLEATEVVNEVFSVSDISSWHGNAKIQMQKFFALDKTA